MKKYTRWIFDITLLVMVGLGFVWPGSLAVKVVQAWALLGIGLSVALLVIGLTTQTLWRCGGKPGVSDITNRVFGLGKTLTLKIQLRFILNLMLITGCLLSAGHISTAMWYLCAVLGFRFTRSLFLMTFGSQPCPEPSA
ncbi:hypothetical protein EXN74_08905 [Leclercia adecarboxylata]|uniref:DNZ54_00345 family protein n=1 Tax=Leclercia adecarboxylata TaxID=83655 RepID=UPI00102E72A4|nr:DNZ54_00345 family protein [Leclercia adecarboxylata]MCE9980041.1 DNZ54_00345 family protein [Leclercia adecarboxylata]QBF86608.1 hypothetical protein EXN74_08905 [Leclercia adecarboxylata]